MKPLLMLLATIPALVPSVALAAPSTSVSASVTPPGRTGFIQFCRDDTAVNTQFTLGDCVGYIANAFTESQGFAAQNCDFWRVWDPSTFYNFYGNYAQCVRDKGSALPF